jgi:para-nitrobenzyl esterase
VQRNIEAFGGDPTNVTLFGESAGAGSACLQLVSPSRGGLFQQVLLESPPCTNVPLLPRDDAEAQGLAVAAAVGCGGASDIPACLRDVPDDDVLTALPYNEHEVFGEGVSWGPILDGGIVVADPATLIAAGASADIPLVVGSNGDEGTIFFVEDGIVTSRDDIRDILLEAWDPATADAVLAHYAPSGDPQQDATDILSDLFTCDARFIARLHVAAGGSAWQYRFTSPTYDILFGLGAFHGGELPFVFGNGFANLALLPAGEPLSQAVQSYWTSFARDARPRGPVTWPPYDADRDESLRLDLAVDTMFHVEQTDCDALDAILHP